MGNKAYNFIFDIKNMLVNLSVILMIVALLINNPYCFLLSSILIILNNIIISLEDIKENFIFLLFNGSFSFFLLSRFIVSGFFGADYEYRGLFDMGFDNEITINIIKFICISIITLSFSYYYFLERDLKKTYITSGFYKYIKVILDKIFPIKDEKNGKKPSKIKKFILDNKEGIIKTIRYIALFIFFIGLIFRIIAVIEDIKFTREIGYRRSYLVSKDYSNIWEKLFDIVGRMYFISYFIYLATLPDIKRAIIPTILFLMPSTLNLFTGSRNNFALDILIILIYFVLRTKNTKILKKIIILSIVALPFIIAILIFVGNIRGTDNINTLYKYSYGDKIVRFFYNQGVSARILGNVQYFSKDIPYRLYSFGDIIDFFKSTLLGKIILNTGVYQGQSVEVFLTKNQLSHVISFIQSPYYYLNEGLGVGSSYIAELYVDFSYIGIILGSFFYGFLIRKLMKIFFYKSVSLRALMLVATRDLLLTPRASFSFFLNTLLQKTQLATYLLILFASIFLYYLYMRFKRKK